MQATESSVLLTYSPGLPIKLNFDDILRVRAMINFILHHFSVDDVNCERYFEEECPMSCTILRALLHVLNESLTWEKYVAEFTLH